MSAYHNTRLIIELYNERGEMLRRRISTCKTMYDNVIESWRKQYGKKFENLIIKEFKNDHKYG